MMKRIKKWGNSLVIVFTSEDEKIYGLKEGDVIEIDDMLWEEKVNKIRRIKNE
jgi:antitoxin component of MazEF toxin-antitoxin module